MAEYGELLNRITAVLSKAGYRDARRIRTNAANGCGFFVAEGVGAKVVASWLDATRLDRQAMLTRWGVILRQDGLRVDDRDADLYVYDPTREA